MHIRNIFKRQALFVEAIRGRTSTFVSCFWNCILLSVLFAGSSHAAELQLFTYVESPTTEVETGEVATGLQSPTAEGGKVDSLGTQITTSETLKRAQVSDVLTFSFEGADYYILIERREVHSNGDVSLIGRVDGTAHDAVITRGATGSVGRIVTNEGVFNIELEIGSEKLISPADRKRMIFLPIDEGGIVPPRANPKSNKKSASTVQLVPSYAEQTNTRMAEINVMVFWDHVLQDRHGVSGAGTVLNQMISYANNAFRNSGIYVQLKLVYSELFDYDSSSQNTKALDILKDSVTRRGYYSQLRDKHGADLVGYVRRSVGGRDSCGIAYMLGTRAMGMQFSERNFAFFVVKYGRVGSMRCPDKTFVHEIGHNLGSTHDHKTSKYEEPIFPYSFGHDTGKEFGQKYNDSDFATIMSYYSPEVAKFSNPRIKCGSGYKPKPCGIAEGKSNAADNAKGFNQVRFNVAGFFSENVEYSLTISSHANGSVSSSPPGISCGNDCSGAFNSSSHITLTAAPKRDYVFSRWGGNCSGMGTDNPARITMDKDRTCSAIFNRIQYTLTIDESTICNQDNCIIPVLPEVSVVSASVDSSFQRHSIECNGGCSGDFYSGLRVALEARPDKDHVFSRWDGDCLVFGATNPVKVIMDKEKTCAAVFTRIQYTMTIGPITGKAQTQTYLIKNNLGKMGSIYSCYDICSYAYDPGSIVALETLQFDVNVSFDRWGGDCSDLDLMGGDRIVLTMDKDITCTPFFITHVQHTLRIAPSTNGAVSSAPSGISCGNNCAAVLDYGSKVALTAKPDKDHVFGGWGGDCLGVATTARIIMDSDRSCTATFWRFRESLFVPRIYISDGRDVSDGTVDDMAEITWGTVPDADFYEIYMASSRDSGGDSTVKRSYGYERRGTAKSGIFKDNSGRGGNSCWFLHYKVRACDRKGVCGPFSAINSVYVRRNYSGDVGAITDVDVSPNIVPERAPVGTPVGITACASDEGEVTYSIEPWDRDALFKINSRTGVITAEGVLNYYKATSHGVRVVAAANGGSVSKKVFIIPVTAPDVEVMRIRVFLGGVMR